MKPDHQITESEIRSRIVLFREQLSSSRISARRPILALTLGSALALMIVTAAVSWLKDVPIGEFTQDAVAKQSFFTGAVSQIGLTLWAGAVSAASLTAFVLWKRQTESDIRRYLLALAVLTAALLADDMFMLHERVVPYYLGLPESTVYLAIAVVALGIAVWHFWTILDTDPATLVLAGVLLALSVLVDLAGMGEGSLALLVEDGFKFLGIAAWLAYVVATCVDTLVQGETV